MVQGLNKNHYSNNEDNDFIFQGRVAEEFQAQTEALNELKERFNKFVQEIFANETEFAQVNKEVFDEFNNVVSHIKIDAKDGNVSIGEQIWEVICSLLEPIFKVFGIQPDENTFSFLAKKKRKSWLTSMLSKFFDKLFRHNFSWQESLLKEMEELQKKLDSGELAQIEMINALEKLELLLKVKLEFFKCQINIIGIILGVLSTLLGLDKVLINSVECTARSFQTVENTFLRENTQAKFSDKVVEADQWVRVAEYAEKGLLAGYLNSYSDKQIRDAAPTFSPSLPVDQLFSSLLCLAAALATLSTWANRGMLDKNLSKHPEKTASPAQTNSEMEGKKVSVSSGCGSIENIELHKANKGIRTKERKGLQNSAFRVFQESHTPTSVLTDTSSQDMANGKSAKQCR